MHDTIWTDQTLGSLNLGYSSINAFDAAKFDGNVSLGKTASARAPFQSLLIVHAFGLSVVESRPSQIQTFQDLETNEEKEAYMISKVLEVMTPQIFLDLLTETEKRAITEGKSIARGEIRHALGITYGF